VEQDAKAGVEAWERREVEDGLMGRGVGSDRSWGKGKGGDGKHSTLGASTADLDGERENRGSRRSFAGAVKREMEGFERALGEAEARMKQVAIKARAVAVAETHAGA
jgi:hypothetical protein